MPMLILVLEDHQAIRQMLKIALSQDKHDVIEASDVESAKQLLRNETPDLAIVDWMLPGASGVDFIRWLRRQKNMQQIPILMLTAKTNESDTITGLNAGADDYLSKPVSVPELRARVQALSRRPAVYQEKTDILKIGPISLNSARLEMNIDKHVVPMKLIEFRLLKFFAEHPDRVWSRGQILDNVWGRTVYLDERTVDVHILRLRKTLKPYGAHKFIKTVRGLGYTFSLGNK